KLRKWIVRFQASLIGDTLGGVLDPVVSIEAFFPGILVRAGQVHGAVRLLAELVGRIEPATVLTDGTRGFPDGNIAVLPSRSLGCDTHELLETGKASQSARSHL